MDILLKHIGHNDFSLYSLNTKLFYHGLTGCFFSHRPPPIFINVRTTDDAFQQSGKQDFSKHILKSLASMHESSGWQFFRTTFGIQVRPVSFDTSRLAMTNFGITEIICSFRLILEGKTGKEIPELTIVE